MGGFRISTESSSLPDGGFRGLKKAEENTQFIKPGEKKSI
jgi:hypothetical protein